MGRILLGIVIGIALIVGGVYVYFTTGMAPAAATAAPMPFERYFAGMALRSRIVREAPKTVPVQATPEILLSGAQVYKQNCAFCHGLPDSQASAEGRGMFPSAPQFFVPPPNFARFRGRRPGESGPERGRGRRGGRGPGLGADYWRVKNGIRLTGMPSFQKVLTDQQMWDVVLMLSQRRNLPPAVSAVLAPTPPAAPAAAPAKPGKPEGRSRPAAARKPS
jgi:thiosulfate dehydrogenase